MIGDGEEQIVEFSEAVRAWKKSGKPRVECLKALAKIDGVYVPSFYDVTYHEDGTIAAFTPNCPEAPEKVRKRIILDMDKAYYPKEIPVPYAEIGA